MNELLPPSSVISHIDGPVEIGVIQVSEGLFYGGPFKREGDDVSPDGDWWGPEVEYYPSPSEARDACDKFSQRVVEDLGPVILEFGCAPFAKKLGYSLLTVIQKNDILIKRTVLRDVSVEQALLKCLQGSDLVLVDGISEYAVYAKLPQQLP
jgi:hypothetical protein